MKKNEVTNFTDRQLMAIDLLANMDRNGLSYNEIAKQIGITRKILYGWRKNETFIKEILKKNPEYDENKEGLNKIELKAIELLSQSKRTYEEIANTLGIDVRTLRSIRKKPEVIKVINEYGNLSKLTEQQIKAIELLLKRDINGWTNVDIAKRLDVTIVTIYRWLTLTEFKGELLKKDPEFFTGVHFSEQQLKAIELLSRGMSSTKVAKQVGVSYHTINNWKKKTGFMNEIIKKNPQFNISDEKKEKAIELLAKPKSIRLKKIEIAKNVGVSVGTLYLWEKEPEFNEKLQIEFIKYKDVPDFNTKQLKAIELLAQAKSTYTEIAGKIGIRLETLKNWENKPEFKKAVLNINPDYAKILVFNKRQKQKQNLNKNLRRDQTEDQKELKSLFLEEVQLKAIEIISKYNSEYYLMNEISEQLGVSTTKLSSWINEPIFRNELIKKGLEYGKDVDSIFKAFEFKRTDYYSLKEFKELLSIPETNEKLTSDIQRIYNVKSIMINRGRKYFKINEIDLLKKRQNELLEKYISYQEASEICESKGVTLGKARIKKEPLDILLRPFVRHQITIFIREDFNKWLESKIVSKAFEVTMETEFETFKYRLNAKGIDVNDKELMGPFTAETWLNFVSMKVGNNRGNEETVDRKINYYVWCTEYLIELVSLTKKKEVYSVTSNDINTIFNEIRNKYARYIYIYLKYICEKFKVMNIKSFNIQKVYNPFEYEEGSSIEKEIYDFDTYKKIYNYAKDISLHKERAIKNVFEEINIINSKGKKYTATSWLYVLLHLNNAWRHSDVVRFPRITLSGTNISDLKWLLENEISYEDADYIIKQVYRTDIIITKTQVKNYFFCSEELKIPFATAIAICELRTQLLNPLHSEILDFGNKYQLFYESRRKDFFKYYESEQFRFSSRKMNRTLMSYIYLVLSKINRGPAALKTVQRMRGHIESETTNIYIDIPEEELNFLSKQLFSRGSFGFIYDTFLDVLRGIEVDREKRTTEIQFLNEYFGDISKIEDISGFLNIVQSERKPVLDLLLSMGLNKTLELINKINTNQLPSKQENIQCILGVNNCVNKGKKVDCLNCPYSVPNYYALSTLGNSLKNRMDSFLESGISSNLTFYEKRKIARLLYRNLELFFQAYKRFGKVVYEFLPYPPDELKAYLSGANSLKEEYQINKGDYGES